MLQLELELKIGDVVQMGDVLMTVVDVDGDDVSFRIDDSADCELNFTAAVPR